MSVSAPPDAGDAVPGLSMSVTGKVVLSAVVAFFFLFVFLLILFLRANRYLGANPAHASSSARIVFPASGAVGASLPRRALDPAVLRSLPVTVFNSATFKDGMDCAVCLSELADADAVRLLPGCRHAFHLKCIDKWFGSNSTCPICRSSIKPPAAESKIAILGESKQSAAINNRALPQEISMAADGSGEGSSSSVCSVSWKHSRIVAIDMPRIALESSAFALQSSRILSAVEVKSPFLASLRSLRILSMGFSSDVTSSGWDIEQRAATEAAAAAAASVAGAGSDGEGSSSDKNCERDLRLFEEMKRIAMR